MPLLYLVRGQIASNLLKGVENLIDKWRDLLRLLQHKVAPALLGDLNKGITGHVLDTVVCLVHELKQLVDNGLQELPVRLQKAGVLSNNVHNVGGHNSLVVLASLHLAETQELLDDSDQETLLGIFVYWESSRVSKTNEQ